MNLRIAPPGCRSRQAGSAVVVILLLLAIMLIYITANLKALHSLKRELKLIETRQVQHWTRLNALPAPASLTQTNLPTPANPVAGDPIPEGAP
jgi:hypothetical protein